MPALVPNQNIEKWRVVRLLAQGGQGAVYEAVREDIGQRGALKVLLAHRTTPEMLQRFINEARAVNAIKHPSIPQVIDHGVFSDGTTWMVMEFIDGETLEARLTKRRLSREEALAITEDAASALDAAHKKNIVHRDIKPSNIMLVSDEEKATGERAMVLDFGIAKLIELEGVTSTGNLVGTPIYMAYEQGVRAKNVDGRADVYSLGVVLYQMLTRRVPFRYRQGEGPWAVLSAKMQSSTPIEKHAPDLPAELRDLVNAMVHKDRAERPTMAEVRIRLRQVQGLPPRQTGSHDALGVPPGALASAALAPVSGPLDFDADEDDDPTGSAASSMIAVQEVGPTPSGLNVRGEISPALPPLPVPKSISDHPSVPVLLSAPSLELPASDVVPFFAPIKRSGPEESTDRPAPTHLISEAKATPSAPTISPGQPSSPPPPKEAASSRRNVAFWGGGALVTSAVIAILVAQWPQKQPEVIASGPVAPASVDLGIQPDLSTKANLPDLATLPDLSQPSDMAHPALRSKCVSRLADASCILTPMMARQREALAAALRENGGVHLCSGERLVITGLPARPAVQAPASWLKKQTASLFVDALRGLDGVFPAKVEILCRK